MSGLTATLARFTADPGFREIPGEAAGIVTTGFIDTIATILAGRTEPVVGILTNFVAAKGAAAREAHVLFGADMASSADAALINATAGHAREGKFSLEFAAACALVARKVGLQELSDSLVTDAGVGTAMRKALTTTVDTRCPHEPAMAIADRVRIDLQDGRTLDTGDILYARGNAKLPLRQAELKAKFLDCANGEAALYERLQNLCGLARVRALMS